MTPENSQIKRLQNEAAASAEEFEEALDRLRGSVEVKTRGVRRIAADPHAALEKARYQLHKDVDALGETASSAIDRVIVQARVRAESALEQMDLRPLQTWLVVFGSGFLLG